MFLGVEIGGTKLQLGLGEGDGILRGHWRGTVSAQDGAEGIRRQIVQALPDLLHKAGLARTQVRGIGIGFGGPVDDTTHTVITSHQIGGWDNFPLADWIGDMLGWPAVLGNDADVAGLAEALFGSGKGLSPVFYITIGSGIGGGFILNGEIYRGCGRGAAEIGHLRMKPGGLPHAPIILEELASGWAIGSQARSLAERNWDHDSELFRLVSGQKDQITAQTVGQAAAHGDLLALAVMYGVCNSLADAIAHVIALLCPRRIVIGGGVSLIGEKVLFEPLRGLVKDRVFQPFGDCYDIVPAALGEEVVVQGALALAKKRLGPQRD
ncbi:MAG TPA: ROK family protein [Gemmataceae bacterium]|jgi:glucokinase|nr:ROK family protein [Gemmataceae bacterium]